MRARFRSLCLALPLAFAGLSAQAECYGVNMMDELSPESLARIDARVKAVPYPSGNFWTASRNGQTLTIIGTYHLDDPRLSPLVTALAPRLESARALLVEAGPDEEKQLVDAMASDVSLSFITTGPTLLEMLPDESWQRLAAAFEDRGIPAFMGAKFKPWYATILLAMPRCALDLAQKPNGFDVQLITMAEAENKPIIALEPFDTVFKLFQGLTDAEQIDMIETALATETRSDDMSVTLADLYFDGESRVLWELTREFSLSLPGYTPERVETEMALAEELLMYARNRAWIPVIDKAAADGGDLVVAFGALHLSGEEGVLNLLAKDGWTIAPLPLHP